MTQSSTRSKGTPKRRRSSNGRERSCGYTLKLTTAPAEVTEGDIAALRDEGLTDTAIHDAACVVAYFNLVNRIAEGLGVELEV